jgi:hypothetical protein
MSEHLQGRTVSYSTYSNHGCRCAGCREQHTLYMRDARTRIPSIAKNRAARDRALLRLKANHEDEFRGLYEKELAP